MTTPGKHHHKAAHGVQHAQQQIAKESLAPVRQPPATDGAALGIGLIMLAAWAKWKRKLWRTKQYAKARAEGWAEGMAKARHT